MDEAIANGAEDRTTDAVERIAGRPLMELATFAQANSKAWR